MRNSFHRENNVARQLDSLESTFFTGNVRRKGYGSAKNILRGNRASR